jgi:hypothetical protein
VLGVDVTCRRPIATRQQWEAWPSSSAPRSICTPATSYHNISQFQVQVSLGATNMNSKVRKTKFNTQFIDLGALKWNLNASRTRKIVRRAFFLQNKKNHAS